MFTAPACFSGGPQLRALVLTRNFLSDAGAMLILKGLCTGARHPRRGYRLEHLDLSRNLLTPEVAPLLADALIVLTSLRSLHLAENRLRDPGAIAIAGSMHNVGGPLEKLDLRSNEIGSRGMHALAKALIGGHTQSNAAASLTDLGLGRNSYVWSMVQVNGWRRWQLTASMCVACGVDWETLVQPRWHLPCPRCHCLQGWICHKLTSAARAKPSCRWSSPSAHRCSTWPWVATTTRPRKTTS